MPRRRPARADRGRPGALGSAATFSFFPSKNLGAFGDGGAITTSDDALAERVRMLRFHGSRDKQTFELVGNNSRLDELQAAILRVQLPHLEGWAAGRRRAAAHYEAEGLGELVDLPAAPGSSPPGTCTSSATRAPTSWPRRSGRPASGTRPTTASPPSPARDARVRARGALPGTTRPPARISRSR